MTDNDAAPPKRKRRLLPTDPKTMVSAVKNNLPAEIVSFTQDGKPRRAVQSKMTGFFSMGGTIRKGPKQLKIDRMLGARGKEEKKREDKAAQGKDYCREGEKIELSKKDKMGDDNEKDTSCQETGKEAQQQEDEDTSPVSGNQKATAIDINDGIEKDEEDSFLESLRKVENDDKDITEGGEEPEVMQTEDDASVSSSPADECLQQRVDASLPSDEESLDFEAEDSEENSEDDVVPPPPRHHRLKKRNGQEKTNSRRTTRVVENEKDSEDGDEEKEGVEEDRSVAFFGRRAGGKKENNIAKSTGKKTAPSSKNPIKTKTITTSLSSTKKSDNIVHQSDDDLILSCSWKAGQELPFGAVCEVFQEIEKISARLEITSAVTALFRRILLTHPPSLIHALYLASNSVAPSYEGLELGIGESYLIKSIGNAYGMNPSIVKSKLVNIGDLGTIAETAKSSQRTLFKSTRVLLAREVLDTYRWMGSKSVSGKEATKLKTDKIQSLLVRASGGVECKYIIRALQGKLRIGLARSTVLVALAWSLGLTVPRGVKEKKQSKAEDKDLSTYPKQERVLLTGGSKLPTETRLECAVCIIKKAYSEVPSFDRLLDAALSAPLTEMHKLCALSPGLPVEPMLAKPTKSVQEVLKRLSGVRFTCEYKYDGERAQVHMLEGGSTKVFSRNLLTTTEKYPEVPKYVRSACASTAVTSFILDTEVVAFNRETGKLVPFQVLSTRKSKDVSEENIKVQVIVQAFDLMYLNGKSLLGNTLAERRDIMKNHFFPVEGQFQFAKHIDHHENGDTTLLEDFLTEAVQNQCEGLMVKTLDDNAIYEPTKRSLNWLKLKKDYQEDLGDSVDLVPIGAYHGQGKRAGLYGAYLLACYDPDTEEYQSVCKIGTGFSDENLKMLTESFKTGGHVMADKSSQYQVNDSLECDVWLDSVQVWEVRAADLSKSPVHTGAHEKIGEGGRGIGLRFPRFERVRPDKRPDQATTSDQILDMYYAQDSVAGGDGGGGDIDDEL